MCESPISIRARFSVGSHTTQPVSRYVPCSNCIECRDTKQNGWRLRLKYECEDLYQRGGYGLFVTLSYNPSHLPFKVFNGKKIPCFSPSDIDSLLNNLKVYMHRNFGKGSYRYFLCSEYGHFTKRQHYHLMLLCEKHVDNYVSVVEQIRKIWSENRNLGFVFPKYKNGRYIDDEGNENSPLFRDPKASSIYASKYITKDMSYFDLPDVADWLQSDKDNKRYAAFHRQSKGIGLALYNKLSQLPKEELLKVLVNGIYDPYTQYHQPIPDYITSKFVYEFHKRCKDYDHHFVNGKLVHDPYIYDRYVTPLGYEYFLRYAKRRFTQTCLDILNFSIIEQYNLCQDDINKLSMLHLLYDGYNLRALNKMKLSCDCAPLFDLDTFCHLYAETKRLLYKRNDFYPAGSRYLSSVEINDIKELQVYLLLFRQWRKDILVNKNIPKIKERLDRSAYIHRYRHKYNILNVPQEITSLPFT